MRAFSALMNTPGAPGIDLPGLDFTALAAGHGCAGRRVETADQFARALQDALASDRPWVIDAVVDAAIKGLFHEG
jgi:benzoylformate decarboxylase